MDAGCASWGAGCRSARKRRAADSLQGMKVKKIHVELQGDCDEHVRYELRAVPRHGESASSGR